MKKVALFAFLFPMICFAQFEPRVALNYSPDEMYRINDSRILVMPALSVETGMKYVREVGGVRLGAGFNNKVWVNRGLGVYFRPEQVLFNIGASAKWKGVEVQVRHDCWHPIKSDGINPSGILGGGTVVSVSWTGR